MIYNSVEEFVALQPRYYRFLKSINLKRNISDDDCSLYEVEIVLSKLGDAADLRVRCTNAFDIKMANIEGMPGLFIDIEDVRVKQLEGGAYRVYEQEEDAFSFYCEEFFAELI